MADYLDATRIRALAAQLDLRPSKGRGQNFLFDANTVRRIVALAEVTPDDTVLEIGPGLGSLTVGLLHTGAHVLAVEVEPALVQQLPITMEKLVPDKVEHLTVIEQDALSMSPATRGLTAIDATPDTNRSDSPQMMGTDSSSHTNIDNVDSSSAPMAPFVPSLMTPTMLVSNLPYNISVPVILHILATFPSITRGLVMVQSEVAARLAAPPGSKVYGVPSAKIAWYAAASRVGTVPPTVFWPAPNVDSGLVRFVRRDPPVTATREATFSLIDTAFSQRRKMLRSVLASRYGPGVHLALEQAGISPQARGETLSIESFARLASHLACED
ncbi:MAG: 16S rRNA (adenine(1518)-N(6)/adenine(1519)-N(6))-dimethyltransferase [Propionibacteriaceae bacterium]|nr:16S rRNA (adenine(1518)-N(6)/adenine(1519)-N(6))-dimethyltransferase [Propionibacteriaceae bacterium]